MIKPTPEQFEEWRSHPVTEWLLDTYVKAEMARTYQVFQDRAWDGDLTPVTHATHRERYETLDWLRQLTIADIEKTLEMQET